MELRHHVAGGVLRARPAAAAGHARAAHTRLGILWAACLLYTSILPGRKGGVPYMAFEYAIRKNGMDPASDLLLDNSIQFDNMTGAFLGGTGDYVTMFEPTASSVEAEGKGYIVAAVGEEAGEMPYTAYFAKKSFIEKNADMIQRFTNAVYKGQKWVAEHSAAEIAEVVKDSFPDTDIALLTSCLLYTSRCV